MSLEQYKGRFTLLAVCFLGVFCSYLANGIVVEKVSRGDGFKFYTSIVLVTTIFNTMVAKLLVILRKNSENKKGEISKTLFLMVACSSSYVMAMMTANAALRYVNYPTQIVGKAGKPVIILLMSLVFVRRTYTLKKCASIFLVVIGVCAFMFENANKKMKIQDQEQNVLGTSLVLVSLLFDGFVAITQEKIRETNIFTAHSLMYDINKWAAFLMFCIALSKGELLPFLAFCKDTNGFILHMGALCLTGVLGQQFIFLTVVNFGPLVCSVITTTRKFFTVLISTFIFQHNMTFKHWAYVAVVFSGLALDFI